MIKGCPVLSTLLRSPVSSNFLRAKASSDVPPRLCHCVPLPYLTNLFSWHALGKPATCQTGPTSQLNGLLPTVCSSVSGVFSTLIVPPSLGSGSTHLKVINSKTFGSTPTRPIGHYRLLDLLSHVIEWVSLSLSFTLPSVCVSSIYVAHPSLEFLDSSYPHTSSIKVAGTTGVGHCT